MAEKIDAVVGIGVKLDDSGLQKEVKDLKKKVDKASEPLEIRIKSAIDAVGLSKTQTDLKRNLKELKSLQLEIGDTGSAAFREIGEAIGETNDKIGDMNQLIKAQSGEPLDNVKNSVRGLKDSLMSLDFKSLKANFNLLGQNAKKLAGDLFGGFKVMKTFKTSMAEGSTATQALSKSFMGLGKAIAATGIGALVIAITMIIANFDELKKSGGLVGKMFTAIGDTIKWVTDKLIALSDMLGLTDIQNQKNAEKTLELKKKEQEAIEARYDKEIALAEAAGKDTSEIEKKKNTEIIMNYWKQIEAIEVVGKAVGKLSDEQKAQIEEIKAAQEKLRVENQVIDVKEKKKKEEEDKKANEKAIEEYKKHQEEIKSIKSKYMLDERQKIAEGYDDDLKKLNRKNKDEEKLYQELLQAKSDALYLYDYKKKQEEQKALQESLDQLDKNLKTQNELIGTYHKSNAEIDAMYADIAMKNQKMSADEIYAIITERLSKEKDAKDKALLQTQEHLKAEDDLRLAQLDFEKNQLEKRGELTSEFYLKQQDALLEQLKHQMEVELSNTELTEQQKKDIIARYAQEKKEIEAKTEEEILQNKIEKTEQSLSIASNFTSAVSGLSDTISQIQRQNLEKGSEADIKAQKAAFKRQKALGLVMAGIDGAKAITSILAQYPKFDGGFAMTAAIVASGITTAAQIAAIASKQFNPETGAGPSAPPASTMPSLPAESVMNLGNARVVPQKNAVSYTKVYVTESDIKQVSQKVNVIESRSRIG